MLVINGSFGEGGGQILRSSLALSIVTGVPFRIDCIRAKRRKPGLMRQHLTAVRAAAEICCAKVTGDKIGSTEVEFVPGEAVGGEYSFSIGTAGSTTLVLQTVLLPLVLAKEPSTIVLEGGTHNPFAPPFDYLQRVYLPLLNRMGPHVEARLEKPGFYPAGGGRMVVDVTPVKYLDGISILERGELKQRAAKAVVSGLPRSIGKREVRVIEKHLKWDDGETRIVEVERPVGPGNIVTIELEYDNVTEMFTGFGEVGRSAEAVATHAVQQYQRYIKTDAPIGEYLTDQLMLPLAVARSGEFRSTGLSRHAETHIELIHKFLDVCINTKRQTDGEVTITIDQQAID
ncbi:MAG: RNA 3'-terminal phosphate cyclase [Planctomycetes bacterium]|nr:RNA 3'-terminal phosphate cyclase [Planctomycetota bacterium]